MTQGEYRTATGKTVSLGAPLGPPGGEGRIYRVSGQKDKVAKIFHQAADTALVEKLDFMVTHSTPEVRKHTAWPLELLYQGTAMRGFIMPSFAGWQTLDNFYARTNWKQSVIAAMNLSIAFHALHSADYVIGDVKPGNVLLNPDNGHVRVVDCDSFQVDTGARQHPCQVGSREVRPPELIGTTPGRRLTVNHDNFTLALLVFKLLMKGLHPFNSVSMDVLKGQDDLTQDQKIQQFRYPYASDARARQCRPSPFPLVPAETLPDSVLSLFLQAFTEPGVQRRPSASEWYRELTNLKKGLTRCKAGKHSVYKNFRAACPFCKWDRELDEDTSSPAPVSEPSPAQGKFSVSGSSAPPQKLNPTSPQKPNSDDWSELVWGIVGLIILGVLVYLAFNWYSNRLDNLYDKAQALEAKHDLYEANEKRKKLVEKYRADCRYDFDDCLKVAESMFKIGEYQGDNNNAVATLQRLQDQFGESTGTNMRKLVVKAGVQQALVMGNMNRGQEAIRKLNETLKKACSKEAVPWKWKNLNDPCREAVKRSIVPALLLSREGNAAELARIPFYAEANISELFKADPELAFTEFLLWLSSNRDTTRGTAELAENLRDNWVFLKGNDYVSWGLQKLSPVIKRLPEPRKALAGCFTSFFGGGNTGTMISCVKNKSMTHGNAMYKAEAFEKALDAYTPAAKLGASSAQFSLGWFYSNGKGIKQDYKEAFKWYSKAADQGNTAAQNNLGILWENGNGTPYKSLEKAVAYYRLSAEKGNHIAQCNLANMLENGRGVDKDLREARAWYEKSAAQGYERAKRALERLDAAKK